MKAHWQQSPVKSANLWRFYIGEILRAAVQRDSFGNAIVLCYDRYGREKFRANVAGDNLDNNKRTAQDFLIGSGEQFTLAEGST